MRKIVVVAMLGVGGASAFGQRTIGPFTARVAEMLGRVEGGHSLSAEDLAGGGEGAAMPKKEDVRSAVPLLVRALGAKDKEERTYGLTVLEGLRRGAGEAVPGMEIAAGTVQTPIAVTTQISGAGPMQGVSGGVFSAEVARELGPAVDAITAELTEESQGNRLLAAAVLGGFGPHAPVKVVGTLTAYLKRDDAVGPVGQSVVEDLLEFEPVSSGTALAMTGYLRRSDQTTEARGDLIDAIAGRGDRSVEVNGALLGYMDAEDAGVRARLILTLPQLALTPEEFSATRAKVQVLAESTGENLRVVTAAKSVAGCWTAVRMMAGCPVY